ncbi:MAG: hypothetical protein V3U57_01955 [Robiginitomaculum sp.]
MANYDVFNGDADGICALLQLRLHEPRPATIITGVKRDIALLDKITAKSSDHITVLDVSMRTNKDGLNKALQAGAFVFYVDHHNAGGLPKHANLFAVIDTRPSLCTSLLINKAINGAHGHWAIVGAFGDNLIKPALALGKQNGLKQSQMTRLQNYGMLINYNAYGREVSDLHFSPGKLYKRLLALGSPEHFLNNDKEIFSILKNGYQSDIEKARATPAENPGIYILEDAAWARRISGSFANLLCHKTPNRAYAILTHNRDKSFTVSVRAPLNKPEGADTLCLQFPTGGGRKKAAGINRLPQAHLPNFIEKFKQTF